MKMKDYILDTVCFVGVWALWVLPLNISLPIMCWMFEKAYTGKDKV